MSLIIIRGPISYKFIVSPTEIKIYKELLNKAENIVYLKNTYRKELHNARDKIIKYKELIEKLEDRRNKQLKHLKQENLLIYKTKQLIKNVSDKSDIHNLNLQDAINNTKNTHKKYMITLANILCTTSKFNSACKTVSKYHGLFKFENNENDLINSVIQNFITEISTKYINIQNDINSHARINNENY